jgi:hypothetical protein
VASNPSQSPKPAAHVAPQVDALHAGAPLATAGHATPHAPQCDALLRVSTHAPLHAVSPAAQGIMQKPAAHTRPAAHARPQPPQCAASVLVFASHPSAAARLQSAKPAAHAPTTHAPAAQACVATLASAQRTPQPPQWLGSKLVSVQPPAHAVSPAPHVAAHTPAVQTSPAPQAAEAPAAPQRPQRPLSLLVFTSQPLAAAPSQSA